METAVRPILYALFALSTLMAQGPQVNEGTVRAHLSFLADDVMEGRGTGQRAALSPPCAISAT